MLQCMLVYHGWWLSSNFLCGQPVTVKGIQCQQISALILYPIVVFPKPTTTPGRQMAINFKLKATAGDCTQNKRGSEPNKFTQRLQVAVSLTWPYLFQLHSRSSFAYVMLVYIPFPATFSLAICLHVCDACIYHLLLHSRCHPRMQSHFLIHICHICDARTYHFPPRVGLA